ncbi:hypothetical protein V8C35DRAFT_292015 [Trichoderma chlorosporum]
MTAAKCCLPCTRSTGLLALSSTFVANSPSSYTTRLDEHENPGRRRPRYLVADSAYDILNQQALDQLSAKGLELRLSICQGLVRGLLDIGSQASVQEANNLVEYIESEIGDKSLVDAQPPLDDLVKQIRVRESIKQPSRYPKGP